MQEDIHISSVLRLSNKTLLKPQTAYVCWTKARKFHKYYTNSNLYEISAVDTGFISSQSVIMIGNAVVNMNAKYRYPVMIINNTSKTIALKKGCVIGKLSPIDEQNVVELKNLINNVTNIKQDISKDLYAPAEHKDKIKKELIKKNKGLFASKDSELGHTDIFKMKIDTGQHLPIKLQAYRASLHRREVIEKAVDEMLSAYIIRKSRSPWRFPVVIVDKKRWVQEVLCGLQ